MGEEAGKSSDSAIHVEATLTLGSAFFGVPLLLLVDESTSETDGPFDGAGGPGSVEEALHVVAHRSGGRTRLGGQCKSILEKSINVRILLAITPRKKKACQSSHQKFHQKTHD